MELKTPDLKCWQQLLSRHDLTWSAVSDDWAQGAFIGNGMIGAMIYKDTPNVYRWELGRCDVLAHFQFPMVDWADPRVPIGDMLLEPKGKIQSETMRLRLFDAQVEGTITTDKGTIEWRSVTHAVDMVTMIEVKTSGNETADIVSLRPKHGVSPCMQYERVKNNLYIHGFDDEYIEDHTPELPTQEIVDDIEITTQPFLTGGECATAVKQVKISDNHIVTYLSTENTYPKRRAEQKAIAHVQTASQKDVNKWVDEHRNWWHEYYQLSFVSMSDTFWEGHYWIQMYKLGSATRSDRALIDTQGPWLTETPWPTCVWNLNVELSYSPLYTSNRMELGKSLCRTIDKNFAQLILNVPDSFRADSAALGRASSCVELRAMSGVGWEVGNLTWVCHNYYRQYRSTMDDELLRDGLYPILRRAINFYIHLMEEHEDGKIHLPMTHSPEYGAHFRTRDANYDLALFKWGCKSLLSICDRLKIDDERKETWQLVIDKMTDFPADDNVLRVGHDYKYELSHRHFSHLFAFFPLHLLDADDPQDRDMMLKSMNHWLSLPEELLGYTWTAACSMSATLGDGDAALNYLNNLKDFLTPNTMYLENGPVIETPIYAAESIHNILLQSHSDIINVFPAIPSSWKDISINNLRAEGAFLVSAVRKEGNTQFVHIESLAGEPCKVKTDITGDIMVHSDDKIEYEISQDGIIELQLAKGQSATIHSSEQAPTVEFELIDANEKYCNYFGMFSEDLEIKSKKQDAI